MADPVEVRNRFDGRWSGGYEAEEIVSGPRGAGIRVRRCTDGRVLPGLFSPDEVRPSRPDSSGSH